MPDTVDVAVAPKRRAGWLVLAGLAPIVASVPLYMACIDNPLCRSTAWPTFLLAGVGLLVCVRAAVIDRRAFVRGGAAVSVGLVGFFVYAFFVLAALPRPADATPVSAPDFTLPDQDGKPVALAEIRAGGPAMLVFYRGHW